MIGIYFMSSGASNHKESIAFINTDKQHIKKIELSAFEIICMVSRNYSAA